jgi:arylsulfatase A-like enzyme
MKPGRAVRRVVLVVCDSLRADLVDARSAPTTTRIATAGTRFSAFCSVFPSTTRTSAASLATGSLPASHGLLGNTMAIDEGHGLVCVSAGKADFLDRLRRSRGGADGRALGRQTLHERVAPLGAAVAMSNVSPGAAYVHDPEGAGYVWHRSGSFGPGRTPLDDGLEIAVGAAGDRVMTERFCALLQRGVPPYSVLWLSEPDHSGHHHALGSPEHRRAIASADACVGRVHSTVRALDPGGEQILFAVCSDHGMQTIRRRIDIAERLVDAGFKASADSADLVVAPQGTAALLSFAADAEPLVPHVAAWLAEQDWAGRVIEGDALVGVGLPADGRLRIAVGLAGDDVVNPHGVRGFSDVAENALGGESLPGHGQHGGLAPYEQAPFLAIDGGGFAPGVRDDAASLIDLAPTFLRHLGLCAADVDGRALALGGPPDGAAASQTAAAAGRADATKTPRAGSP